MTKLSAHNARPSSGQWERAHGYRVQSSVSTNGHSLGWSRVSQSGARGREAWKYRVRETNKGLSIIVTIADGGCNHLPQAVGEYISIEHQIQWKMNRLQGCNFDGL